MHVNTLYVENISGHLPLYTGYKIRTCAKITCVKLISMFVKITILSKGFRCVIGFSALLEIPQNL